MYRGLWHFRSDTNYTHNYHLSLHRYSNAFVTASAQWSKKYQNAYSYDPKPSLVSPARG
jgi:hypothetical protein